MGNNLIKIAYVLTSNCKDSYADMNLISVWSLRKTNPTAKILLVCDTETVQAIKTSQHQIKQEIDEIISVDVPANSASFRNRYIKTNLRHYVNGPFLYLDGDTLIRDDLSPIFNTQASLAGVPNHSGTGLPSEIPPSELKIYEKLGWSLPSNYYVNGGVLFFADHPEVYEFCSLWHERWKECSSTIGKHLDQPSLNRAIDDSKINFAWLEHRFNAQVHARPHTAWNAAIWHIYLSEPHASLKNVLAQALAQYRQGTPITSGKVAKLCQRPHPWLINNPLDSFAVSSLKNNATLLNPNQWERLWLADQYLATFSQIYYKNRNKFIHKLPLFKSIANKLKSLITPNSFKS